MEGTDGVNGGIQPSSSAAASSSASAQHPAAAAAAAAGPRRPSPLMDPSPRASDDNAEDEFEESDDEGDAGQPEASPNCEEPLAFEEGEEGDDDDGRVRQEVGERKRVAAAIRREIDASRETKDRSSRLSLILEQGEAYARYMLARSTGGRVNFDSSGRPVQSQGAAGAGRGRGRGRRGRTRESAEDDELMLREAEDELEGAGSALFTRVSEQPGLIKGGTMKPYQLEGLNWLIRLYESGINGILADEMGLGKTLQTISLIAWLRESRNIKGPFLVIAPKSTLGNWMNEIRKWCPDSIVGFKFHGNKEERAIMISDQMNPETHKWDVCVTSYEMACKEKAALCKFTWRYVIIDEAHRIKNEASKLSRTVRLFKTQFRLLITGTPLQNNLHELWALLNFLFPEMFSSAEEFDEVFNLTGGGEELSQEERDAKSLQIVHALHKILRPFLLRRVKADVTRDLPPKKEIVLYVRLSNMQKKLYRDILSKNVDAIQEREGGGKNRLLNLVMQLRKACNHPYLFEGFEDPTIDDPFGEHLVNNAGKVALLDKLMTRLKGMGSRCLIFSQMVRMLDILEDFCNMRGHKYCRIDGNTGGEERDQYIDEFNAEGSEKFVFLLSTRAGGLGINLATADVVVLFDSDWNPQVDLQAMDRAHRIGQKKPVKVYRFVHENTIEEKVIERANLKLRIDSAVIQQGRLSSADKGKKTMSKNELRDMIQFGADELRKVSGEITEEDIDEIIKRGEERTADMNERLQKHAEKSVLDFRSDGGLNVYEFEGTDYAEARKHQDRNAWAEMGIARADEDLEARRKARIQKQQEAKAKAQAIHSTGKHQQTKAARLPVMHEWQLFDRMRLQEIHETEVKNFDKGGLGVATVSVPVPADKKEKQEQETDEANGASSSSSSSAAQQPQQMMEQQVLILLPPEVQEEKARLLSEGFGDWTKKEFSVFVRACEQFGRENIARIAAEVDGKTVAQVKEYAAAFWERGPRLMAGWEKIVARIQEGERRLRKHQEVAQEILQKVRQYDRPWEELKVQWVAPSKAKGAGAPTGGAGAGALKKGLPQLSFTENNDRYLLNMTALLGYGQWDALKGFVRRDPRWRFDWFLRSRTAQDLGRRVDALVRQLRKEREAQGGRLMMPETETGNDPGKSKGQAAGGRSGAASKKGGDTKTEEKGASPEAGEADAAAGGGQEDEPMPDATASGAASAKEGDDDDDEDAALGVIQNRRNGVAAKGGKGGSSKTRGEKRGASDVQEPTAPPAAKKQKAKAAEAPVGAKGKSKGGKG
uniref:Uncharacterized protein n=1 Tax=Chromera velia CCMP2878 TaxID=1169474 RepID=A0A0G4HH50_9ALVE|eukprot:Cvel_6840.t1-p1 / transcript=Cvel_6840.t1 / gene=Cvel_6840 / organism=Chromera_velia_CCMP2878 / gene_product=Probable chromatin-remodeling complex ATPase chain, putative / transcript_product=Probable chromatin-remodeling complex ATPase chain, putative / location=Cvel_scaffold345:17857-27487(+) / protein_length=1276 / sequence_SO=supercontig / SO=protein_coding / is_pseudo=false